MATLETTIVHKGTSNIGILKHVVKSPEGLELLSVIEKQLPVSRRSEAELKICTEVHKLQMLGVSSNPLLQIYSINRSEGRISIVCKFYEGVGRGLSDFQHHAGLVAHAVHQLNSSRIKLPDINQMERLYRQISSTRHADPDVEFLRTKALSTYEKIKLPNTEDDLVKSHNDLHFTNMATETDGSACNIVFLDLGMMGLNYAGAEFHHFARRSLASEEVKAFFVHLATEYSRLSGRKVGEIYLNAYLYALLRSVVRNNFVRFKRDARLLRQEIEYGWMLLDRTSRWAG